MEKEIDEFMFQNKDKIIILDYILLPLTKYLNMCDIKILLDIPYEIRRDRVIKRDNITEELFLLRESSSIEYNKKEFNIVINNSNEEIFRRLKIWQGFYIQEVLIQLQKDIWT